MSKSCEILILVIIVNRYKHTYFCLENGFIFMIHEIYKYTRGKLFMYILEISKRLIVQASN